MENPLPSTSKAEDQQPVKKKAKKEQTYFQETCYSLLFKEIGGREKNCLSTGCKEIDKLFGSPGIYGLDYGMVTEFCGFPGSGKTQLCIQLCATTILDGKKAFYVDTKGAFSLDRFLEITKYQIDKAKGYMSINDILDNLLYLFAGSNELFTILINQLEIVLREQPKIKIVVIDSLAFHLNVQTSTEATASFDRTRKINEYLCILQKCAYEFNVAIIVTNSMTTKFQRNSDKPIYTACLGELYYHRLNQRIKFSKSGQRVLLNLDKSPYNPGGCIEAKLNEGGIEAITSSSSSSSNR